MDNGAQIDWLFVNRDLVVVGASAGGVESLRSFLHALPADLPAAVLIVLHLPPGGASMLPSILRRVSAMPVAAASGNDPLRPGKVLVAPPDYHLMVVDDYAALTRGPRESGHRPAVDVLFRSAARAHGPRVVGVILSGALDDGTAGMLAIRQRGGLVLAQDPADAAYPGMPRSVVDQVGADHVGTAQVLGHLVGELTGDDLPDEPPAPPSEMLELEVEMAALADRTLTGDHDASPAGLTCPDCEGSLFAIEDGGLVRFRCRVGHAWSALALSTDQSQAVDRALWMAVRTLEERAALSRQLAEHAAERGNILSRQRFLERAREATDSAVVVRRLLEEPLTTDGGTDDVIAETEGDHADQR